MEIYISSLLMFEMTAYHLQSFPEYYGWEKNCSNFAIGILEIYYVISWVVSSSSWEMYMENGIHQDWIKKDVIKWDWNWTCISINKTTSNIPRILLNPGIFIFVLP